MQNFVDRIQQCLAANILYFNGIIFKANDYEEEFTASYEHKNFSLPPLHRPIPARIIESFLLNIIYI